MKKDHNVSIVELKVYGSFKIYLYNCRNFLDKTKLIADNKSKLKVN
jgi:hypothetical protein